MRMVENLSIYTEVLFVSLEQYSTYTKPDSNTAPMTNIMLTMILFWNSNLHVLIILLNM